MAQTGHSTPGTKGRVLHSPVFYDALAWLLLRGREQSVRERLARLAHLAPGESVLDVGCGTGSLAIAAKRLVGTLGRVEGIDASEEMIARARRKAARAREAVRFTRGVVEALPFPDREFDAVVSTLMLHHLPRPARLAGIREAFRVLKPGGRLLAVDFGEPANTARRHGLIERFHKHGHVKLDDLLALALEAGFEIIEQGPVGVRDLVFVLAAA